MPGCLPGRNTRRHAPGDRLVLRGSQGSVELHAFWLDAADRVTAGMHLNQCDTIDAISRMIESGGPVDAARLTDTALELDTATA
jgi:3-phenylpropionate/trans-cinnamate dioxygenase ferredoxin reductase subunit